MDQNSAAIIILCSHLCAGENIKPFEPAEWSKLADRLSECGLQPCGLLSFTNDDFEGKLDFNKSDIQRISRLIGRSGSIAFEIKKYASMGINIMTKADNFYPEILKEKLGRSCPPIFYYAGNPEIANKKFVGFVGSRNANADDEKFTALTAAKTNANGFAVVSGGAKGIDSISSAVSIINGSFCVEYIADSMINKIKSKNTADAIINNRLLILSAANPDTGFNTGIAMMRNKFIYAQSNGTVVIKSDYNTGGTWNGAVNNLNKQWCVTFCRNNPEYKGNMELIKLGAVPIDETWDGDVLKYKINKPQQPEQLSLFDEL